MVKGRRGTTTLEQALTIHVVEEAQALVVGVAVAVRYRSADEDRFLVGVASRRLQQQVEAVIVARAVRARPRVLLSHTQAPPLTTVTTRYNVNDGDVHPRWKKFL